MQMHHVPVRVCQNLDLNMAGPLDQPLDKDRAVAESGSCLAAAALKGLGHVRLLLHHSHTAATAASAGFELCEHTKTEIGLVWATVFSGSPLTITGKLTPDFASTSKASAAELSAASEPGTTGTPRD